MHPICSALVEVIRILWRAAIISLSLEKVEGGLNIDDMYSLVMYPKYKLYLDDNVVAVDVKLEALGEEAVDRKSVV